MLSLLNSPFMRSFNNAQFVSADINLTEKLSIYFAMHAARFSR